MTKSVKILVSAVLLGVVTLVSYVFFFDQTVFVFRDLEIAVSGEKWQPEVLEKIQKKWSVKFIPFKNKNLWQLPLGRLNEEMSADPGIMSVSTERIWPNQVKVSIQLKPTLFIFFEGKKMVRPITADGNVLAPILLEQAPDVPFLRNKLLVKSSESLKKLIELYQQLPIEGAISKTEVAEVDWNESHGLLLEMSSGIEGQIILGHGDVLLKAKRVANVLKYLESQNQKWRVIDAGFAKKVLVRLRKHS